MRGCGQDAVLAVLGAAVLSVLLAGAGLAASLLSPTAGLLVPPLPLLRKSVTYQPVPFNWKPAAVSCFLNASLPQDGQVVNAASDTFCKTSFVWPQSAQR